MTLKNIKKSAAAAVLLALVLMLTACGDPGQTNNAAGNNSNTPGGNSAVPAANDSGSRYKIREAAMIPGMKRSRDHRKMKRYSNY